MLAQAVTFVLFSNLLISTICNGIRPSRSDIWHLKQESFCGQSFVPEINHRIVGGSEANFGQFPWQAQIWTYKPYNDTPIFSCGGTLISDELILTAAHCVPFTNPERLASMPTVLEFCGAGCRSLCSKFLSAQILFKNSNFILRILIELLESKFLFSADYFTFLCNDL